MFFIKIRFIVYFIFLVNVIPRDEAMITRLGSRKSVRPSVGKSVCLSVCNTHMLCDKTKQCTADILISHESAITLVF